MSATIAEGGVVRTDARNGIELRLAVLEQIAKDTKDILLEIKQEFRDMRREFKEDNAELRREMKEDCVELRRELKEESTELRHEDKSIREHMKDFRSEHRSDFRLLFGAIVTVAIGLASLMAHGFHWL